MKDTKEITTGAMLLAIFGAILLLDRQFSFALSEIIALVVPVLITVYGHKFTIKSGLIFSIALLLISFIVSPNIITYFYIPVGVVVGNIYSYMLFKNIDVKIILVVTIVLFSITEVGYSFVISPIFLNETFDNFLLSTGNSIQAYIDSMPVEFQNSVAASNISIPELLKDVSLAAFVIIGVIETAFIYLLTLILFKRFNISASNLSMRRFIDINPVFAYILLFGACLLFVYRYITNTYLSFIIVAVSLLCMLILDYYGYIFILMYLGPRRKRSTVILLVLAIFLFMPFSFILLMLVGFLYGSGPFKNILKGRILNEKH